MPTVAASGIHGLKSLKSRTAGWRNNFMGTLLLRQFPVGWSEKDVHQTLAGFGAVIRIMLFPARESHERFAFVDMVSKESASSAAKVLDGVEIEGVCLRVETYGRVTQPV